MPGNQVVLTFAGEEKPLVESMGKVGSASEHMSDQVGSASKHVKDAGEEQSNAFGKTGEAADNAERNIIGVHDVIDGTATIMQGPGKQGIVAYIQGWADLAGGLAPLLLQLAETKVATIAQGIASKAAAVGTTIWTGAQRLLNLAFVASPIGWIVLGIGALVAVIVLIATKTDWFQRAWGASWKWIKAAAIDVWDWLKQLPGWIGSAFGRIAGFISTPYRVAFNLIADAWNHTIGRLHFTLPSWIPGIGGNSISVPNLPHFRSGGTVPGGIGEEVMAVVHGGEKITQAGQGDAGATVVQLPRGALMTSDALVAAIGSVTRGRGGNVQLVLGGGRG